jgi:sulfate transport system permease protein
MKDNAAIRWGLTVLALAVITVLVIVPVIHVFAQALADGPGVYLQLFTSRETRHAMLLTLLVAPLAVLSNTIFGVTAAWAIARFRFPGRTLLITLIDLPFAVSPVVAGLLFVLLFGAHGLFGGVIESLGMPVINATPGLILATAFVTFPFVARELIPVMEALGPEEELAALSLGARAWQIFWYVTLPNIKWGLLYGVVLCNARAMGEFGAVYVVSGHIPGRTLTIPLEVERLFQSFGGMPSAFALASLLTLLGLVTLLVKTLLERRLGGSEGTGRAANPQAGGVP